MRAISLRILAGFAAVYCCVCVAAAAEPAKKPNIVWIIVDDMSANLSCYGERLIKTPNVDRLAAEGTRFAKAFTTAPVSR